MNRLKILFVILLSLLFFAFTSFLYRYEETKILEKELSRIDKEIYLKEVCYKKKVREFEELEKKHKKQTDQLKAELSIK
ncbi:hypothetical protein [uncultured Flavobacterium sp.]|uniref:hypothetical protein n=1 Tax=uncultured Flavobacterium sp. TaxID=165435 RepID=UPI00308151F8